MIQQLYSIFAFCTLAMAAFGLGRPLWRGLGLGEEDRLSAAVWSVALGLIAAGLLWLGLGLLGLLYVPLVGVITMVACAWGLSEAVRGRLHVAEREAFSLPHASPAAPQLPDEAPELPDEAPWGPPGRWVGRGIVAAAVCACLGSLVGALAPPTAGDALCYHLELPKTFLLQHEIGYLPYHDNATFPLLAEMWYLWALALDGGVGAQLVHWGLGVLLALATVVLATPLLGRPWAWVAGALVVLTPGVNNQMTAPLNDVALAAMTTLALAAWWRAAFCDEDQRWFVVAGVAAGGALGTKYIALVFAAALAAVWIWCMVRKPHQRRFLLQGAAVVAVVAASIGGPWYARAAWYRGNPVFPFLGEVFGDAGTAVSATETLPKDKAPLGRDLSGLLSAPWQVTMHPERFGGRGHQLGVVLLAAVPGMVLARRLRGLGTLLTVALGYGVLWYLLRQNVRFLFPAVAPLCVAATWVWIELRRFPRPARWISGGAFACAVAASCAAAVTRCGGQVGVAVGWEDRDAYLVRHEPTYRAAAVANALLGADAHLLSQDYRAFYFDHRVTRENFYRRYTHYDREIRRPTEFGRRLREAGFTHLLLAETVAGDGIGYDSTLSRLAEAQWAVDTGESLCTLDEYFYRDADGALRHYRLVWLR
ncbi:MAG: phospholipid carrier-dependent glycosyltransferase [Pirellulales bacterium]|nr:phospholipid carrier-dependent glycosyltransferase [Pirellulales bacterium]